MGRKYKVFDREGQKELFDSLENIFTKFFGKNSQTVIDGSRTQRRPDSGFGSPEQCCDDLSDLLRKSARLLLVSAIEMESEAYLQSRNDRQLEDGRAAVIRNGYHPERDVQTGIGPVSVRIPEVRSRDGQPAVFRSAIVPPYVRKAAKLESSLSWLYLQGLSTGNIKSALEALIGPEARGFSAATVSRLKRKWAEEYDKRRRRDLSGHDRAYIRVDGIHSKVRGDDPGLCTLVVIGVDQSGKKHFLSIENGVGESKQSRREVLSDLKARGMEEPKLAIGDGAPGFWSALPEVYGETREQRCRVHKTANVLNCLPKTSRRKAKRCLHDIRQAETKEEARKAFDLFIRMYGDKYPKAAGCLERDREQLPAFYDFPARHWRSIRTTNPIESSFGTIRHRTRRAEGCLNSEGMLHMIFKLGMCAENNWRRLNGFDFVGKVITGVKSKDGIEDINQENEEENSNNWSAA